MDSSTSNQLLLRKKLQERKRALAEARAASGGHRAVSPEVSSDSRQPPAAGLRQAKTRPTTPPGRETPPPSPKEEEPRPTARVLFEQSVGGASAPERPVLRAGKQLPLAETRAQRSPRASSRHSPAKGGNGGSSRSKPSAGGLNYVASTAGSVAAAAASTAGSAASAAVSVAGSAAAAAGSAASAAATATGLTDCLPSHVALTLRQRATSTVQRVDMLREAPLFSGVSVARMAQIADTMTLRDVVGGEKVITQGQTGDEMFVVQDGLLEASVRTDSYEVITVKLYTPGSYFGELALVNFVLGMTNSALQMMHFVF